MHRARVTAAALQADDLLSDISATRISGGADRTDLLAFVSPSDGGPCRCVFAPGGTPEISDCLLPVPPTEELERICSDPVEECAAWFITWSGIRLPGGAGRYLLIRVDQGQSWLLRIPFTLFIRRNLQGFEGYDSVGWIVTERSFEEVVRARVTLREMLFRGESLMRGTLIVLNTYQHHRNARDWDLVSAGIATAEILLNQLQSVPFADETHSMRWLKNPRTDELNEALMDPQTRIVIGAFESGNGAWELGQPEGSEERQYFDLISLRNYLKHILLMRVFHCYSIFDPYLTETLGTLPADQSTVVRQLLDTEIFFVEGAIVEESYLEFLAFLFQFLMCGSLAFLLRSRAGAGRFDWAGTAATCNRIFEVREFDVRIKEDWR